MPEEIKALLDSSELTSNMEVDIVFPEIKLRFDDCGGNDRVSDIAFVGRSGERKIAVTIEAKGDESFGETVAKTFEAAVETRLGNPRSRALDRVVALPQTMLRPWKKGQSKVGDLRYQLLTAMAGTLANAHAQGAEYAVMLIHEFKTEKTDRALQEENQKDLEAFVERIADGAMNLVEGELAGPIVVGPGCGLYPSPTVPLLIGKIVFFSPSS